MFLCSARQSRAHSRMASAQRLALCSAASAACAPRLGCSSRWPALAPSRSLRPSAPCRASDGGGEGGDPSDLESKFRQELERRRMASPGPDGAQTPPPAKDPFATTTTRPRAPPPPKVSLDGTQDQRQRSINMVNEGIEGLIPRASQLLQLGGSVFLAFLPFMVVISLLFSGIYFVFGESFVHRGTPNAGPPVYLDPEKLLSESTVDPYVPFQR